MHIKATIYVVHPIPGLRPPKQSDTVTFISIKDYNCNIIAATLIPSFIGSMLNQSRLLSSNGSTTHNNYLYSYKFKQWQNILTPIYNVNTYRLKSTMVAFSHSWVNYTVSCHNTHLSCPVLRIGHRLPQSTRIWCSTQPAHRDERSKDNFISINNLFMHRQTYIYM